MPKTLAPVDIYHLVHRDANGITSAVVAPAWGRNVLGLTYQANEWAWPIPILEAVDIAMIAGKPTSYGVPILAPTPGRVGLNQNGLFRYAGNEYSISPTRHGFLRNLSWQVESHSPTTITCVTDVMPDPAAAANAFPFQFHADYHLEVAERTLRCCLRIQNTSDRVQPIDVGWHPYLHRSGECVLRLPARGRWELDEEREPTPTGRVLEVAGRDDFRGGRLVGTGEHWDDVFTDLTYERGEAPCWVEERAQVLMENGTHTSARVRRTLAMREDLRPNGPRTIPNVQLYTPPGRNAICIEPLSAPPNAINLLNLEFGRASVCELNPEEVVVHEIIISVGVEELST